MLQFLKGCQSKLTVEPADSLLQSPHQIPLKSKQRIKKTNHFGRFLVLICNLSDKRFLKYLFRATFFKTRQKVVFDHSVKNSQNKM